ncbi:MAG TPA: CDP-alcohol phosphatidyltransferase family protein [Oscillospiraceae bacterium]|nr:CDP-alcohol phosphatidyltransferase family protein [Oscillospiraceae bacterium]HNW04232.1 CDP-alcohol phosphatidyltransferase family protein [Oscillospiraceae bacterium]HPV99462.1 CDP-alcohol phosphatidyltransferase family protein [Oscillospiraceae bacterium]
MKPTPKIFTIPNLISLLRLILIPGIVLLYFYEESPLPAFGLLLFSTVTDLADGRIARKYHMVSDLGKTLDPIADKATLVAVLVCLLSVYPPMRKLLYLLVLREIFMGIAGTAAYLETGTFFGAGWHGKAATFLINLTLLAHMLHKSIPAAVTEISIAACSGMAVLSFLLYCAQYARAVGAPAQKREPGV